MQDDPVTLICDSNGRPLKSKSKIKHYLEKIWNNLEAALTAIVVFSSAHGDKNNPYPTLYCRFKNGHPFEKEWYIDKQSGIRYTDDQIIDKEFN